jgi:hypothetical protein
VRQVGSPRRRMHGRTDAHSVVVVFSWIEATGLREPAHERQTRQLLLAERIAVAPARVLALLVDQQARRLDLASSAAYFLALFLDSPLYRTVLGRR